MSLLAYARLVRLPNAFTALADIALGAAVASHYVAVDWAAVAWLAAASACLYSAGMVWNDYFDIAQDRAERPHRPLPSGAIRRSTAGRLGAVLLAGGVTCAAAVGVDSVIVAAAIVGAVLAYDGPLKRTPLGPVAMGSCRFLNVLLAFSWSPVDWGVRLHIASIVGVYIVGVTWFARTEARHSDRRQLLLATTPIGLALAAALLLPLHHSEGGAPSAFPYLLAAFGFFVGLPVERGVRSGRPGAVQPAVKRLVLGLIALDATLAAAFVGLGPAATILLLFIPGWLLAKIVYST